MITVEFSLFPQATNPDAPSFSPTNDIEFIDPCISPFTFTTTSQTSPGFDKYSGNQIVFSLTPFTITPTICEVEYTCISVVKDDDINAISDINCSDLTSAANFELVDGKLTFSANSDDYENMRVTPGNYEVTITGTAVTSGQTDFATFVISMVDPCDPPNSIAS